MGYKLTLNVEKELAEQAKVYARSKGRSLSNLVENYFKMLSTSSDSVEFEVSSKVKSLQGSIKIPDDFDYKTELSDQLSEKYRKDD